jgi:hypothetical protein
MDRAYVTQIPDALDEIIALQAAEPGTGREFTADEQAIVDRILDAEDDYIVTIDEGGDPVWYLADAETPDLDNSTEHTRWPAGQTWPRRGAAEATEPEAKAIAQASEDWPLRHDDMRDAEEAADTARAELLNDPAGWPRYVPAHWQPAAWADAYRAAYKAEWEQRAGAQ